MLALAATSAVYICLSEFIKTARQICTGSSRISIHYFYLAFGLYLILLLNDLALVVTSDWPIVLFVKARLPTIKSTYCDITPLHD